MTWQDLGSIGELVSAVAVIVSLVYLALQIRQNTHHLEQNTKAQQATAFDSSINYTMVARQAIFTNEDVSQIYVDGCADPDSLSERDRMRFRLMLHNILWSIWNLQSQSRSGGIAEETWLAQIAILKRVFATPGARWFWLRYRQEFGESFQQVVQQIEDELSNESEDNE